MVHRHSQKAGDTPIFTEAARYGKPAVHVPWPEGLPTHSLLPPPSERPFNKKGRSSRRGPGLPASGRLYPYQVYLIRPYTYAPLKPNGE